MDLPRLFRTIHNNSIFATWVDAGQPPIVNVLPKEPIRGVSLDGPGDAMAESVTIVSVRCRNDRGILRYEAASPVDLKVAEEWAARHKDTPPEDFARYPNFDR